jgi:hypothetical protein
MRAIRIGSVLLAAAMVCLPAIAADAQTATPPQLVETYDSRDARAGLSYARHGQWRGLEARGSLAAGYFARVSTPAATGAERVNGGYYQVGGGLQRPFRVGATTVTPYYDLSYGRNQQTLLVETTTLSHEPGVRADGRLGAGQLTGSLSWRQTKQVDGLELDSEQTRAYLDYNRPLLPRGALKLQAGYARTDQRLVDNLFASFTSETRSDLETRYLRADLTLPLWATGISWRSTARADRRVSQDGREERAASYETGLSQQVGVLYYELGYRRRQADAAGVQSAESLWYVQVKRPFTVRF